MLRPNRQMRFFACLLLTMASTNASGLGSLMAQSGDGVSAEPDPLTLFEPREFADDAGNTLKYRLLKPKDFNASKQYPLVIFLHGAGERGDDNAAQLVHGMAEFCKADRRENYPCYVLAPQCPNEQTWSSFERGDDKPLTLRDEASDPMKLVLALMKQMLSDSAIDKNRVYITGLSMGGYGTWDALARLPEQFAAAAPICGGGDLNTVSRFKEVPVWCFHGDQDEAVPVQNSRDMVAALEEAGGSPKYTEYAGVGHDSWTETYQNEAFYEWLFSQRNGHTPTTSKGSNSQ